MRIHRLLSDLRDIPAKWNATPSQGSIDQWKHQERVPVLAADSKCSTQYQPCIQHVQSHGYLANALGTQAVRRIWL